MAQPPTVEEITFAIERLEPVVLAPRLELGGRTSQERISNLISLGRPIVMSVHPEIVKDKQLRAFLLSEKRTSRFSLVHIVLSFHPTSQFLESVVVSLSLSHRKGPQVPSPIAWSLSPAKLTSSREIVDKVGLTAKLGIISYQASQESNSSADEPLVVAVGERESDPEWRFTGSRQRPLVGVHGLSAVVQAPSGVQVLANLLVAATIRGPLGLTRYRAELEHDYRHLAI